MPIIIQIINIYALVASERSENNIKLKQDNIPNIGNKGTNGTLKGLFKLGSFFLNMITAIQIAIKAVKVP